MYIIDLDGTMYKGNSNIDGAIDFINYLNKNKIRYMFLTNNASRTKMQNKEHMLALGFSNIDENSFYTSSMAACNYVRKNFKGNKAFYIGADGLYEALKDNGFEIVNDSADFVFVGLDINANYRNYSKALNNLMNGAILIGTNNDRKLPHNDKFNVGNGAIVKMLEYASEQESIKVGKPHMPILTEILNYAKVDKDDVILIGDNLETDIALGFNNKVKTIMVTSGVHTKDDVLRLNIIPDRIISNLKELIK